MRDSREAAVVFLLDGELVPAAEPALLVALGQGAAVRQDEVRAQVGDDGAETSRAIRLHRCGTKCRAMGWVTKCAGSRNLVPT